MAMEVKAVVSVVTRKLTDMLTEESVPDYKIMIHQLKGVQESLKKLQQFSVEENISDTSQRARDHLQILYEVEDEIEKFTFQAAQQRKKFGFKVQKVLFFINLNSRHKLRRKMKKIQIKIERLNQSNPLDIEPATPCSTISSSLHSNFSNEQWSQQSSLRSISDASASATPEEEGDSDNDDNEETHARTQKSSSAIWPIPEAVSIKNPSAIPQIQEPLPNHEKLTFSYSHNEEEMNFVCLKEEHLQYPKKMSSFSYQEEELGMFGFDDDVNSLVEMLTKQCEKLVPELCDDVDSLVKQKMKQQQKFVHIVGEVGSGKTTLVRAVYKNRKIKDHFEFRNWVSLSKEDPVEHILLNLSKKLATFKDKGATNQEQQALKERLLNHLRQKRYLIVLDGVGGPGVLEDLQDALPDVNNGSKIIFTSCKAWTSTEMSLLCHYTHPLRDDDSWNLFLKKAGKDHASTQIPFELKQRILDICKGLPLNIILVASLLSTKRSTAWPSLMFSGKSSDDVLSLCYNHLGDASKLCLLYLVLFPKDYDIPVRRLLRLWLAEGFVKRRPEEPFPEDLVQKIFEDLVNRSMIQITKLRSDNSPRQCRLVSVLHDYLLPKAQDISLFHIHRNLEYCEDAVGPFGVRRMIQYVGNAAAFTMSRRVSNKVKRAKGEKEAPPSVSSLSHFFSSRRGNMSTESSDSYSIPLDLQAMQSKHAAFDPSLLRSFVSFNIQRKDMPEKEVGIILCRIINSSFGLLRVLDLEGVCKPSLPEKLGHLCHLRYLGLRWTFLESLPESVGDLPYLETLDVKHTRIDSLPDTIWKLKHLRNLNLNNIRLARPPRSSSTLLTLWGLVVDEKISVKEGLGKLRTLRELGITFNLSTSQNDLMDWIARLTELQSLRVRSVDDMGHPSKLVLKPLSELSKLSHLNLLGNLERLPNQNEFPPTVKVLTLSISLLNKDPMETLGQLPCLIVLRLLANSYTGIKMVCHRGGFKKLQVLKLWMLKELKEWDVEEEAMESLKELDIRCCHKLNDIPSRLLKQRCLDKIILTGMPDEFKARVKERKPKYTSLTVNNWNFAPLPWEQDNISQARGERKCIGGTSSMTQAMEVESRA